MSKLKKSILIAIGIIGVLGLFIFTLPNLLSLISKDIPPIDDRDLQLQKVTVPQEENAYYDLVEIEKHTYVPEGKYGLILDHIAGKAWDEEFVEELLSRNEQAFTYLDEARRKPKFQDPVFADPAAISTKTVVPVSLGAWRKIARLSSLKALYLAKQEKGTEAFDEALKPVKIGQKIQESQVPLIEYLTAVAMKSEGLKTMQKIVALTELSPETLIKYVQKLDEFEDNEEGLRIALKIEYLVQIRAIDQVVDSIATGNTKSIFGVEDVDFGFLKKAKNSFYFQPNRTKALFAGYARSGISNVRKPCGLAEVVEIKRLAPTSPILLFITKNAVGKIIHDLIATALNTARDRRCEDDLLVSATQLLLTLKAYEIENGRLPVSLDELVPRYIPEIPEDPFDGKAIRYSATKKILYSVGKDSIDTGGSVGEDWRKMDDPTFKINF